MSNSTESPAVPTGLHRIARRMFRFVPPEPLQYWAARATQSGNLAVMWTNPHYNKLVDADQWKIISAALPTRRNHMLDLGCGTGRLSGRLGSMFASYTGVDVEGMIEQARKTCPSSGHEFVVANIQDYDFPKQEFDMVLTIACLSCGACELGGIGPLLERISSSLAMNGRLLMMEPLHRHPLLARQLRVSATEVIVLAESFGLRLKRRRPLLFWPFRLILTRTLFVGLPRLTGIAYRIGEQLLRLLPECFGDYSLLIFERTESH